MKTLNQHFIGNLVAESLLEFERGGAKRGLNIGNERQNNILRDNSNDNNDRFDAFTSLPTHEAKLKIAREIIDNDPEDDLFKRSDMFASVFFEIPEIIVENPKIWNKRTDMFLGFGFFDKIRSTGKIDKLMEVLLAIMKPNKIWNMGISRYKTDLMKLAYEAGANPASGRIKPYIIAVSEKDIELLRILLDHGTDPSFPHTLPGRKESNYPIRRAATNGWYEGVRVLMDDDRVDPSDNKDAALKMALEGDHTDIIDLLLTSDLVIDKIGLMPKTIIKKLEEYNG